MKYSKIELEKEMKACQEAEGKISILTSSIAGIREKVRTFLNEIPAGVKESFQKEIKEVKDWQSETIVTPITGMNSTQLNKMAEELQKVNEKGHEMFQLLIEIKEVRREKKARELIGRLERLMTELDVVKTLLSKWKQGGYENITSDIGGMFPIIERGDFIEAEKGLNLSEKTIAQFKQEITSLETQDNQRRYVLKALRDVCKGMGWGEEKEPALEDSSNSASSLIYEVETYYAGKITFRLTLEGINIHSPISIEKGVCYKELMFSCKTLANFTKSQ